MTVLERTIRRELPGTFDRRAWTIELHPWGISFRAKRTRKSFPVTWNSVFNRTMEIAAASEKAERARIRKDKRGGK